MNVAKILPFGHIINDIKHVFINVDIMNSIYNSSSESIYITPFDIEVNNVPSQR